MAEGKKKKKEGKCHYLYTVCDEHIWRVFLEEKVDTVLLKDVKGIIFTRIPEL